MERQTKPNIWPDDSYYSQTLGSRKFLAIGVLPFFQEDWFFLSGASLIIVILVVVVIVLFFVVRRQSRQLKETQAKANQITPGSEPTSAPAPALPADESPTVPSAAVMDLEAMQPSTPPKIIPGVETQPAAGERPANINWQIAGATDVGRKRELNEDNMILIEAEIFDGLPCGLYVVADGMGGHAHGEVASQLTIETIQAQFSEEALGQPPYETWFNEAIQAANEAVIAHQNDKDSDKKMGSTLVMALIADGQAHLANVGDSRAYHMTNDSMTQVSVDHSLVERLIEIGQITREEARTHKQRNVIYSTIGDSKAKLKVGLYHIDLNPGDRLLLCSDGLSGMLTDEQILNINRSHVSPTEACHTLIKAANAAGGEDNITAILIEMDVK
jgi:protein phosphatase